MIPSDRFLPAGARALVVGASGGIGSALVGALHARLGGRNVVTRSRSTDHLDITDEASVAAFAQTLTGSFDLIICATGALELDGVGPEKTIKSMQADHMRAQFETNALGPAMVLKYLHPFLATDRHSLFAVLTARIGSIEDNRLGGWISYRAAKAAANQIIKTAAIELARTNPNAICVALHPGTVDTDLTRKYAKGYSVVSPDTAAQNLLRVMSGLTPDQTGSFWDWKGAQIPW